MTRIVFGCFEVPGWGGLTTATYRLFQTMLSDGLDVHYVNLILDEELPRFQSILGTGCENPRGLPNVHSCIVRGALHEPHPEIAALLEGLSPDRVVGVGDISSLLMKKADPERELVFLTAGCMQVNRDIPFTEQLAALNGSAPPPTDWKEREAMGISDLVLTHSPFIRDLYRRFYPDQQGKIHPEVFWFAEWICEDAAEYSYAALPFEERDIDALFVASSWLRKEKNPALLAEIASRLDGLSIHIVGEFDEAIPSAAHHGFVGTREELFRLMGRSKTVVSPSLFDAAPGILFEGSVMGSNVVASKNCGNWELCNEQLLINDYGADAFAEAIVRASTTKFEDNLKRFLTPSSYESLKSVLFNS